MPRSRSYSPVSALPVLAALVLCLFLPPRACAITATLSETSPPASRILTVDPRDPAAIPTLKQAAALVQPGDTLVLASGSGPYRESLYINRSGTAAAPITIEGNGNEITGFDLLSFTQLPDGRHQSVVPVPYPFVLRHAGKKRIREDAATRQFSGGIQYDSATRILILPPDVSSDDWEVSARNHVVRIQDVSHHRYRNIVATGSRNDGFNLHGTGKDLHFENITGSYNLDEGFSAHDDIHSSIAGGYFFENDNGIYNIGRSHTRIHNVDISQNLGIGFGLADGTVEASRLRVWGSGMVQLKLEGSARLSGLGITVYRNPRTTRQWLSYKESAQRLRPLTLDTTKSRNPGIPGLITPDADSPETP